MLETKLETRCWCESGERQRGATMLIAKAESNSDSHDKNTKRKTEKGAKRKDCNIILNTERKTETLIEGKGTDCKR